MSGIGLLAIYYLLAPQTWIVAVFGALIGSFLNVCIWRLPEGTFFKHARSMCRACGAPIPFWLNIPIFGWFILRGRTYCCRTPLSPQYPIVEALTAVLFVVLYWKFPFVSFDGQNFSWDAGNLIRFVHGAILLAVLIICSGVDFRHMIIPDVLSLPMIALTPVVIAVHPDLDWVSGLVGTLLGGLVLYAIAWAYWLARREVGMGMGDVKLLAAIGGWLGYQSIIPTILFGSTLGALTGISAMLVTRRLNLKSAIPFGPFLAIGATIHLLFGQKLQEMMLGG